jgi:molecular chaperone DnaK
VAFDIDANGILNVSAKDTGTGKQQSIQIKSSSGLSDTEVQKMTREAEAHAAEDKKKREVVDLKNHADQLIYSTEKTLKEHGEKVPAETRSKIENAVNNLKEATKSENADAIKKAMENLGDVSQEIGKTLYEEAAKKKASSSGTTDKQADTPPPEGEVRRKGGGDDVIDAEFEAK